MDRNELLWELQDTYLSYEVPIKILVNGVKYDLERLYEEDYTIGNTYIVLVAKENK